MERAGSRRIADGVAGSSSGSGTRRNYLYRPQGAGDPALPRLVHVAQVGVVLAADFVSEGIVVVRVDLGPCPDLQRAVGIVAVEDEQRALRAGDEILRLLAGRVQ